MTTAITIPTTNLAPQEWIAERDNLLSISANLSGVANDWEFQAATEMVAKLSEMRKSLEQERKAITGKFDAAKKEIMAQERDLVCDIESEYNRLRQVAGDYATAKAAEREAAERARREALAEREMIQQNAQESFGDAILPPSTPAPFVPDKLKAAPGRKQVIQYIFQILDPAQLDRKFLSPDEGKIRSFVQFAKSQGIKAEDIQEPGLRVVQKVSIN